MPRYRRSTRLPVPVEDAFAWHERPGAFERLTPPFLPARLDYRDDSLREGAEVVVRLLAPAGRLSPRMRARHTVYDPPTEFRDEQVSGPFAHWRHRHLFEPDGEAASILTDDVTYRLPLAGLGAAALAGRRAERELDRLFAYRHRVTVADLSAHARARNTGTKPMHVVVTGASGLIGRSLVPFLTAGGHRVTRMVRREPGEGELRWDPERGEIDAEGLRGADAVVHLAGEPIAAGRWTEHQKRRILDSRSDGTKLVAETLAALDDGPRTLVSSSGIDYYGDRGDEIIDESTEPGDDFLADVCVQWEAATTPATDAGVRVVTLRTGMVLTPAGGALAKLLPLFRVGAGGRFGSGRQWTSWVSIDDVVGLIHHALTTPELAGPVNATAPEPVSNAVFARTLGQVLRRPAVLPVPRFGPRLLLGEMADVLLFHGQRARPARALASDYAFRHPELEGCLRDLLGLPHPTNPHGGEDAA